MPLEKPRFRRDLEARPVVADGQSYIEVRDAVTARTFLFYDFEYQVALALDGLPLAKVIPWVKLATGLVLDVGQLREFAERLRELGFLEPDPEGATALRPRSSRTISRALTSYPVRRRPMRCSCTRPRWWERRRRPRLGPASLSPARRPVVPRLLPPRGKVPRHCLRRAICSGGLRRRPCQAQLLRPAHCPPSPRRRQFLSGWRCPRRSIPAWPAWPPPAPPPPPHRSRL